MAELNEDEVEESPTAVSSKVRLLAVGISLELKKEWRNSFAISKSTSQWLLGAAGKAEIKNR